MQIKDSMNLAGQNLLNVLDPDHDYAPTGGWLVTHDTGRWWDAMLRLEAATGFAIPAHLEGAMLRNLDRFTDNPDGLLFVPFDLGYREPIFELHSLREAMLAFSALARYRHSRWAIERGRRMLETLQRALRSDGTWDEEQFAYSRQLGKERPGSGKDDMTGSTGRLIEALLEFYQAGGDALALELAGRMARFHFERSTTASGHLPEALASAANVGHTHSYLGTLRGLLRFGLLTRRHEYVERVAATYKQALPAIVKESGWAAHDLGHGRFFDRLGNAVPEVAAPGDVAQLALWLAVEAGYTDLLDDAQRLVLSRLLPSQITAADDTPARPVTTREMGAYGGVHSLPHGGKNCTIDVTAAVLHTLTDIYQHIAVRGADGLRINFALDYEDDTVQIAVEKGAQAVVTVDVQDAHERAAARARLGACRVGAPDRQRPAGDNNMIGSYALIPCEHTPGVIRLSYDLPERHTVETTAKGQQYHFTWRGDEIMGVSPNDDDRPFYATL